MIPSADFERRLAAVEAELARQGVNSRPDQNTSTDSNPTFANVFATGSFDIANNEMRGYENTTLANGASITLTNRRGLVLVSNNTNNICELLIVSANGTATSIGAQGLACNLNSDAGATLAVFTSGGTWVVKNKYGVAKSIRVQQIGN